MEFATIVAEEVLGRLTSYASQEISLAWGAQLELTRLNETLSSIKLVLQDAEKKQVKDPLITHWLRNLKDVCHDVDDVLDEMEFGKLRKKVLVNNHGKVKGKVRQFFSRWNPVVTNFRLGHRVKEIRERLIEIEKDKSGFALVQTSELVGDHRVPQHIHDDRRTTTSKVVASHVIGRDEDKKQIMKHLLNHNEVSTEENVSVISIIGLGGLGKTTLAKLVYNDSIIEDNFETKMWICVSDNFDIRALVRGITNAADGPKCDDESLDLMERKLQNTLLGKKFLLVLDDVWDTELIGVTRDKWIALKSLLIVGAKGSKIIITTRSKSVALIVNSFYTHFLKGLSHKDCMSLFIQRAFNKGEEHRFKHLIEEVGEDIVKKCGGLPLAVATLGGMLYMNRERPQWLSVRDDDIWGIENDNILPTLKLSYDALPPHLKPCFAFCALFPKDFEFVSGDLIPLWSAHGYLKTCKESENFEQVGLQCIRQFCSRSLFQIVLDIRTQIQFKIHDLVHDLAISVAQVEYSSVNSRPKNEFEMVRHMSIFIKDLLEEKPGVPDFMLKSNKLRTFLILENGEVNQYFVKTCIARFKYMRVLDLSGSPLEELPNSIGNLCHLRCLNLSCNSKIKRLPNSICKLLHLESLDLSVCSVLEEIPEDIGNLINLRQLLITTQQAYMPKGIGSLTALQLLGFRDCVNLKSLGEEFQFLANLKQLWISCCENLESLPPNMKLLTSLNTLFIYGCKKLDLMKTREGPQHLRSFWIGGSDSETLPPWLEDSAKVLQSIAVSGCDNLIELPDLHKFTFLEQLVIQECSNLLALPRGMHCLTEFKELRIVDCPKLSKICKRQLKSEDWSRFAREAEIILDSDVDTDEEEEEEEDEAISMVNQGADDEDGSFDHTAKSSDNWMSDLPQKC